MTLPGPKPADDKCRDEALPRLYAKDLTALYQKLFKTFGPQHWWPGQTRIEIIVGAILTQNTNWGNVEKAIKNLKQARVLTPQALKNIPPKKLSRLIKPAGYFNVKTKRLKNFISFLFQQYNGSLTKMSREETKILRGKLLTVNGIGPETADSILLYAFDKPVFVVDAYTRRILLRHNMIDEESEYHDIQALFVNRLDHDKAMFNEYHALIVQIGKNYCKPKPRCEECVLRDFHYPPTLSLRGTK